MMSEGNSALLPTNVDRRLLLLLPLHIFLLVHVFLFVAVARFFFVPRETVHFVSLESQWFPRVRLRETSRFSGNKMHCFPRDQSLSVYYKMTILLHCTYRE